ncbi:MAG: T9SS type A sorting domain-containing protein [Candidatus Cloacimonetes bacterium]|nr:T9SS type A sorting domain-containing protein [Candidatus Cloacimonadota bacterium]
MKKVVLLLVIGVALIAWLPQTSVMADEIVWEYSTGLYRPSDADRLPNGNTLITDMWHDRIIEVTPDGTIVWEYTGGGPLSMHYPADAERLPNGNTLIADRYSGYPFQNWDRALEVDTYGNIVWQMRAWPLQWVMDAERLSNGNTLITCKGHYDIVIEVTPNHTIVWEYSIGLDKPYNADRLSNGNTLITDLGTHRVFEVTQNGTMVWLYSNLHRPTEADRLSNGNTLISDFYNYRVIEVTPDYNIVWEYFGGFLPREADRLPYGNTLITDYDNNRIIEVGLPFAGNVSVPDTTYGAAGDTVSIPVNREDVMGVGVLSAEFNLTYNSDIITGIDVDTSGTLLSGTDWTCQYSVVGDTFFVAMAGTDTLYGSGTLINLLFVVSPDAQPEEESPLHFDNFMFNQGTTAVITLDGVFVVESVDVDEQIVPSELAKVILYQNYPNPFNPSGAGRSPQTTISYTLPKSSKVSLKIYNIKGRLVETLVNEVQQSGYYSVVWNAEDISSGIYFYRITAGDFKDTKKCIILK